MKKLISKKHFSYEIDEEKLINRISNELNIISSKEHFVLKSPPFVAKYKEYKIYLGWTLNFDDNSKIKYIAGSKPANIHSTNIQKLNMPIEDTHAIMKIARLYYTKLMYKYN